MVDGIIIGIIIVVLVAALLRVKNHFKGGCCGSGSKTIRSKKTLTEAKLGEKVLLIEGMHCENCQARVENAVNRLDGVVCKVNLRKKEAVVSYSKEVSNEQLKEIVEKLGYQLIEIR
ncbi:MAG: heavy-metal-associated domain-containing protein [Oscillospiraceae bacterium]|nr:heavy-metal-associated domain-containing protein [Oscillospiraceae bacterium]